MNSKNINIHFNEILHSLIARIVLWRYNINGTKAIGEGNDAF